MDGEEQVIDYRSSYVVHIFIALWRSLGTLIASLLPILAILALYFEQNTLKRIGITVAFTSTFGICLILFTSASIREVFTASAT